MWESQVLLTDGQVVFPQVFEFSPTFDEWSARYKWNIFETQIKKKKMTLISLIHTGSLFIDSFYHLLFLVATRAWFKPARKRYVVNHETSVAQLDAPSDWRPRGHVFNPRWGRQHSFVEIDREIFSTAILSLLLIKKGSCQFLAKECAQYWLTI